MHQEEAAGQVAEEDRHQEQEHQADQGETAVRAAVVDMGRLPAAVVGMHQGQEHQEEDKLLAAVVGMEHQAAEEDRGRVGKRQAAGEGRVQVGKHRDRLQERLVEDKRQEDKLQEEYQLEDKHQDQRKKSLEERL